MEAITDGIIAGVKVIGKCLVCYCQVILEQVNQKTGMMAIA